jgi:D-amino-acid dehydrogenase
VIGRAKGSDRIIYAFCQGHLGLTLAAVTARYVADLFSDGAAPQAALPQRFSSWNIRNSLPASR